MCTLCGDANPRRLKRQSWCACHHTLGQTEGSSLWVQRSKNMRATRPCAHDPEPFGVQAAIPTAAIPIKCFWKGPTKTNSSPSPSPNPNPDHNPNTNLYSNPNPLHYPFRNVGIAAASQPFEPNINRLWQTVKATTAPIFKLFRSGVYALLC